MTKMGIFIKTMSIISNTIMAVLLVAIMFFGYQYYNKPVTTDSQVTEQVKTPKPLIVKKAFSKLNTLIVGIGDTRYVNSYKEPKMWGFGFRELDMDLSYTYTLGVKMDSIEVLELPENDAVVIEIPKDVVKLDTLKIDWSKSKVNGEHSFAVEGFNPTEVKVHLANAEKSVKDDLLSDNALFQQGNEHLKANLRDICTKLGVNKVIFKEN